MEPIRLGISVLDRHSWRPRHGAKLTLDRAPGWMELYATRHVGNIPRVFLYGPVALVLPLLLSFSGRGELPLKSIGFTALALWLAVDLWHLVLKKKWRWRFIAGWTGTSLLLIGAIGMMYLLLAGKLADEREEVRSHIGVEYSIPPGMERDPRNSVISITNNSSKNLSDRHLIACQLNATLGKGAAVRMKEAWQIQNPDGSWQFYVGQLAKISIPRSESIRAGGDAESSSCIRGLNVASPICEDVTISFEYYLQDQPTIRQEVQTRIVAYGSSMSGFRWYKESLDKTGTYCSTFLNTK